MPHKHKHNVYDGDLHFTINPTTRTITNMSSQKTTLIQYDHNSERFTFELPRYVEEHDMSLCNVVEVHYINIDATTKATNEGVYPVTDLQISPDDEDVIVCSWLISQNATKLVGPLNFLVRFACVTNNLVDYAWNTAIFTGITVSSGIYNSEIIVEQYADVLEQWKNLLASMTLVGMEQTEESTVSDGINVWSAVFADGSTKEFRVRNGSKGDNTPQKGIDYWTPEDIASIHDYIDEAVEEAIESGGGGGGDEPVTPTVFSITNNLTRLATSNPVITVPAGSSYSATLTANSGCSIESVTVKMGDVDITASAYSDGNITIPSVTGNVLIIAVGTEQAKIKKYTFLPADLGAMIIGSYTAETSQWMGKTYYDYVRYNNGVFSYGTSTVAPALADITLTQYKYAFLGGSTSHIDYVTSYNYTGYTITYTRYDLSKLNLVKPYASEDYDGNIAPGTYEFVNNMMYYYDY